MAIIKDAIKDMESKMSPEALEQANKEYEEELINIKDTDWYKRMEKERRNVHPNE